MSTITKDAREALATVTEIAKHLKDAKLSAYEPTDIREVLEQSRSGMARPIKLRLPLVSKAHQKCFEGRLSEATLYVYRQTVEQMFPEWTVRITHSLLKGRAVIRLTVPGNVIFNINVAD